MGMLGVCGLAMYYAYSELDDPSPLWAPGYTYSAHNVILLSTNRHIPTKDYMYSHLFLTVQKVFWEQAQPISVSKLCHFNIYSG